MSPVPATILVLLGISLVAGCGGSGSTAESPSADSNSSSWDGSGSSAAPAGPNCDDGTCFSCGDGICPTGAYCDESAPEGAACGWLPECPGKTDCACLLGVLGSSCSCEVNAEGGPLVSCD